MAHSRGSSEDEFWQERLIALQEEHARESAAQQREISRLASKYNDVCLQFSFAKGAVCEDIKRFCAAHAFPIRGASVSSGASRSRSSITAGLSALPQPRSVRSPTLSGTDPTFDINDADARSYAVSLNDLLGYLHEYTGGLMQAPTNKLKRHRDAEPGRCFGNDKYVEVKAPPPATTAPVASASTLATTTPPPPVIVSQPNTSAPSLVAAPRGNAFSSVATTSMPLSNSAPALPSDGFQAAAAQMWQQLVSSTTPAATPITRAATPPPQPVAVASMSSTIGSTAAAPPAPDAANAPPTPASQQVAEAQPQTPVTPTPATPKTPKLAVAVSPRNVSIRPPSIVPPLVLDADSAMMMSNAPNHVKQLLSAAVARSSSAACSTPHPAGVITLDAQPPQQPLPTWAPSLAAFMKRPREPLTAAERDQILFEYNHGDASTYNVLLAQLPAPATKKSQDQQ